MTQRGFIILVFIFILLKVKGQTAFDNYYKPWYLNLQSDFVVTQDDSSSVVLNYLLDSASMRLDVNLFEIGTSGNVLLSKTHNMFNQSVDGYSEGRNHFIDATKTSYIHTGVFFVGSNQGIIFSKFSKSTLDTIVTKVYSDNSHYHVSNLIKLGSNKFYAVGNSWNTNAQWPVIFHLDSNLNILQKIIVNTSNNYATVNAVFNTISKRILLGGLVPSGNHPNCLIHIDTLGSITQSVTSTSYTSDLVSQYIFCPFDTTYITYGAKNTSLYGNTYLNKLCISKYDKNLNVKWQKVYGDESVNNSLSRLIILSNGDLVASGFYSKTTSLPLLNENVNGVILKVNSAGYFRWMREWDHVGPGHETEGFYGVTLSKDRGFTLCGNKSGNSLPMGIAWVVKTDSLGCITPGCLSSTIQVDSIMVPPPIPVNLGSTRKTHAFKIYPNPASEILNIAFENIEIDGLKIRIVNVVGELCLQSEIKSYQSEIEIRTLPSGVYFIQLLQQDVVTQVSRFVKH